MSLTVQNLRKIFTEQGVKGASKWKREVFVSEIAAAELAAHEINDEMIYQAERESELVALEVESAPANDKICGFCTTRPRMTSAQAAKEGIRTSDFGDMCIPCYRESGWENTHSDGVHAEFDLAKLTEKQATEVFGCWICYPELNEAKKGYALRAGTSKVGMVIYAKGTVTDKIAMVQAAAEDNGYKVVVDKLELDNGHRLVAMKSDSTLVLSWNGTGGYVYPGSFIDHGKEKKVRNVSEALRFIG